MKQISSHLGPELLAVTAKKLFVRVTWLPGFVHPLAKG